jgi:phospholipid-binding lipoprotein MlaA
LSRGCPWKPAVIIGAAIAAAVLIRAADPAFANAREPAPMSEWRGASDPLEPVNRGLYSLNRALQKVVFRPVLLVIITVLPKPVQRGLHYVLRNLGEPVTVLNDLLQLKIGRAAMATGRFVSNSTLGLLGLFDVATEEGLPYHASDFGQTLGRYGVPTGPYLFVPVIGPSSLRDAGARFFNGSLDPFSHLRYQGDGIVGDVRTVLSTVDTQAQVYEGEGQADPYVATRTAYLQRRGLPARTAPTFEVEPGDVGNETERHAAFASVSSTFFQPVQ